MNKDWSKITEIEDLRRVAERKIPRMFYDYVDSGSWTETTYRNYEQLKTALPYVPPMRW